MSSTAKGTFKSPYGDVKMSYPGPTKRYANIKRYNQSTGNYIELQAPAIRAFKAAEERQTPKRMRRKGKIRPIPVTGHGGRDYAYQKELYEREPGRFANPDSSQHVEFLAVDINLPLLDRINPYRRYQVFKAMKAEGFFFAVSGEPWHGAFRVAG
jgi:hypothetical protein